jgi:hypothetical protein
MSISLKVTGDHAAITKVAQWLDPDVSEPLIAADLDLAYTWSDSQQYWVGLSGNAFRDAAMEVRNRSKPVHGFLQDLAEVLRAYANRLKRGQDDFDDYATQATEAGLTVAGTTVLPPTTWLTYCPADDAPTKDTKEYDRYLAAMKTYNTLEGSVGKWWGELQKWIAENLAPLTTRVSDLSPLDGLLKGLTEGNKEVVTAALEYSHASAERDLSAYRQSAQSMQADADKFTKALRSGNPALRAAAEAANPREIRAGLSVLNEAIESVDKYAKVIPVAGGVIEVVAAGAAIADGDSPSSVGAGLVGSAGGAAAGGAIVAASTPPGLVALTVGVLAVGGGLAGRWLWEAAVPLDIRESIDDSLTGSPPMLYSESTGTWAVGTK